MTIFHKSACVAIVRLKEEVLEILMQDRVDKTGRDLPGGRLEDGETSEQAAIRETEEECGLTVELHGEIGDPFLRCTGEEGEELVTTRLFAARVISGVLRTSAETTGFAWVSLNTLDEAGIKGVPTAGYPKGKMHAMIVRALEYKHDNLSCVNDPDKLAKVA